MRLIDADALIEFCAERWIPLNIDAVNMQPTIQPEKAQLSKEGTTSDLISRTETAEHLRRVLGATVPITDYDDGFVDGVEFGISTVSTMPTIQPVATDTNVGNCSEIPNSSDAINRQDAIDALDKRFDNIPMQLTEEILKLRKDLRELPPIQPERKKGKWIYNSPVTMKCNQCGLVIKDWDWHRFKICPNCGADMRGKQQDDSF